MTEKGGKERKNKKRKRWGVHERERERERERVVVLLILTKQFPHFSKFLQKLHWVLLFENWKLVVGIL